MLFYYRVQRECLAFSPLLPSEISELCIRGVNYLGHQMDWLLRREEVCIILREHGFKAGNANPCDLQVVLKASGTKIPLMPGNTQRIATIATSYKKIESTNKPISCCTMFFYFASHIGKLCYIKMMQ